MRIIILSSLFFCFITIQAQNTNIGFRLEPFLYSGGMFIDRPSKDDADIYFTSFYLTYSIPIDDFFQAQARLGYLATKTQAVKYNGLEATALLFFNYKSGFMPTIGLNFHKNDNYKDNDTYVKELIVVSPLFGFEGRIGDNFQWGLTIQFPVNNEFIEYWLNKYHVRYLIKLSVGWEFVL